MDWARVPSLAALRAFEAAARHQSFSKAARDLNVTHAAIAHHVRSLEAELSENLVERQGRGIAITAVGLELADDLRNGFLTIADGIEKVRARVERRSLNISVTPAFATNWLMPRIGEFWAKHPDVSLNINPSLELVDLRKSGTDLAIRYGDGNWPGVQAEMLTDGDFWVVAHRDLVGGATANCLAEVTDLPWVMERNMMERMAIVEREGINFEEVDLTLLNTNSLVLSAVASGLGVSVQPKSLVEPEIQSGALTKICELNQENLGYYMVVLPERHPRGLREFSKWLRSSAAGPH